MRYFPQTQHMYNIVLHYFLNSSHGRLPTTVQAAPTIRVGLARAREPGFLPEPLSYYSSWALLLCYPKIQYTIIGHQKIIPVWALKYPGRLGFAKINFGDNSEHWDYVMI